MNNSEYKARELANRIFEVQVMKHAIHSANIKNMLITPTSRRETLPSRKLQILKDMAAEYSKREAEVLAAINQLENTSDNSIMSSINKHLKAIRKAVTGDLKFHAKRKREREEERARAQFTNPVTAV